MLIINMLCVYIYMYIFKGSKVRMAPKRKISDASEYKSVDN